MAMVTTANDMDTLVKSTQKLAMTLQVLTRKALGSVAESETKSTQWIQQWKMH